MVYCEFINNSQENTITSVNISEQTLINYSMKRYHLCKIKNLEVGIYGVKRKHYLPTIRLLKTLVSDEHRS